MIHPFSTKTTRRTHLHDRGLVAQFRALSKEENPPRIRVITEDKPTITKRHSEFYGFEVIQSACWKLRCLAKLLSKTAGSVGFRIPNDSDRSKTKHLTDSTDSKLHCEIKEWQTVMILPIWLSSSWLLRELKIRWRCAICSSQIGMWRSVAH